MKKIYALYNPYSGNNTGKDGAEKVKEFYKTEDIELKSLCDIGSYAEFFASISPEDDVVICGGDGTISRFINETEGVNYSNDVYFYATGTGNDFLRDIGRDKESAPLLINEYIKDLPVATVNDKKYRFLNNIGFGIDGYCCEVGDKLRAEHQPKIDYTSIAIKGLLFHYRPTNATVIVDGVEHTYKKVWIAPTMNGRYYGGGMMPTPAQDRLNEERTVSVMLFHGTSKLSTLMIFPSLFKGEHLKHKKHVEVLSGHKITVRFDGPRPAQIDGETIRDVTEYTVESGACVSISSENTCKAAV